MWTWSLYGLLVTETVEGKVDHCINSLPTDFVEGYVEFAVFIYIAFLYGFSSHNGTEGKGSMPVISQTPFRHCPPLPYLESSGLLMVLVIYFYCHLPVFPVVFFKNIYSIFLLSFSFGCLIFFNICNFTLPSMEWRKSHFTGLWCLF